MSELIVKQNIPFGSSGALAYTRGQRISADAVKANGWEDFVVATNTKEARQILAEVTGEPLAEDSDRTSAAAPAKSTEKKG